MDYTSIATIDSSSSPTLTAVSTGTATLTATVGSVTANATVTVLSGTSLPAGTAIWSSPTPSGFTVVQTVQAVPTSTGPALYSVMADSSYANTVVTALTSDGQKLWTSATLSGFPYMAYADGNGGALVYVGGQLYIRA